jgi:hypothetical protein
VQAISSRMYLNPDIDTKKNIFVAGTARSGTTWLGDVIASQMPCRIMFEPFNPDLVPEYSDFNYFQYIHPDSENPDFYTFAQKIFTGKIRNRWIDHQNERIFSEYRLIKEIRANLVLKWLYDHFPEISMIFLIRHPCAVVASRMELGWATENDIRPFTSQPDLIQDHLGPYMDLIKTVKTIEEKHAIIWSVSNLVPLRQFRPNELKIVYYENLCVQPQTEMISIFHSIGQKPVEPVINKIDRPSQTARVTSAIVNGTDKITAWEKKLSPLQIENILQIVDKFNLSHLYGSSHLPLNKNAI